jgi:CRP/FNR family cyclic AMP-dependent transcriptional regulator
MSRTPRPRPVKANGKAAGAPLFDPAVFLATAAVGRDISKYAKKDVIFAQGDGADAVFYIKKGKVKVAVISEQGKEAVVALLGADEFVGEGCLIGQPKRLATASAMTECEIMRVEKREIQRVIHEGRPEPILAKISQETLAEMIGTTRSRVSHFMNKFRELGFINYNGHLEVHSSLLGVLLADQPRTVNPPT